MPISKRYELSVLLVTYNHARFVVEAIESVLAQNFGAPFEIVIADDASTDGTRDAAERRLLAAGWSDYRVLDHARRLGLTRNYERGFDACESRFVAVLEGDDYWHRPDKLARQIAFLSDRPECALCATNILVLDASSGRIEPRLPATEGFSLLGPADLIAENRPGNFSACVYRIEALRALPSGLFTLPSADWIVNICAARQGPLGLLHEPMSVYRQHAGGAWSGLSVAEQNHWLLKLIPQYDLITGGAFQQEFEELQRRLVRHGVGSPDSTV